MPVSCRVQRTGLAENTTNSIYRGNLQFLPPAFVKNAADFQPARFTVKIAKTGDPVLFDGDARLFFDSPYNPRTHAERYVDEKKVPAHAGAVLVKGLGSGYRLFHLLRNVSAATRVIVLEHNFEAVRAILEAHDLKEILSDKRVSFICPGEDGAFHLGACSVFEFRNFIHLDGGQYAPDLKAAYNDFFSRIVRELTVRLYDEVTYYGFYRLWQYNFLKNLPRLIDGQKRVRHEWPAADKPVVIIAPGSSLSTVIADLQKNRGRYFLIALPSAVRYALHHGLVPDLVVCLDAAYWSGLHLSRLPVYPLLAVPLTISPHVIDQWQGDIIFFNQDSEFEKAVADGLILDIMLAPTVAAAALKIAVALGSRQIAIAGMDLANAPATHIRGTGHDRFRIALSRRFSPVADQVFSAIRGNLERLEETDNGPVYVDKKLSIFYQYIEHYINGLDYPVIDLTGGGLPKPFMRRTTLDGFLKESAPPGAPPPPNTSNAAMIRETVTGCLSNVIKTTEQCVQSLSAKKGVTFFPPAMTELARGWNFFDMMRLASGDHPDETAALSALTESLRRSNHLVSKALDRIQAV